MVQVHTYQDEDAAAAKMPAYKVVTNYDSMFSDLPQYPSHSYVPIVNGLRGHPRSLHAGTINSVTSSSGLQVTGKDRALFFRRPVLQMSYVMPLPHIRYTREMSLSVDDVAKSDERKKLRQRQLDQLNRRHHQQRSADIYQERCFSSQQPLYGRQVTITNVSISTTAMFQI